MADLERELDDDEFEALLAGLGEEVTPEDIADLVRDEKGITTPEQANEYRDAKLKDASDLESLIEPVGPEYTPAGEITGMDAETIKPTTAPVVSDAPVRPVVPDPHDAADYYSTRSAGGLQQPLGVEDTRQNLVAEARRVPGMYNAPGLNVPQQRVVGEYEKEFMANNSRPTDQDIRRNWIIATIFGDKGDAEKGREFFINQRQAYDEGVAKARAMDRTGGRVSQGMAELLVGAGLMSAESAVQLRADDPALDVARSLGATGVKLRGQDTTQNNAMLAAIVKLLESREDNQVGYDNKTRQLENNLAVADLYSKKKAGAGGGGGPKMDPDTAAAYYIATRNGGTLETARKFLAGTLGESEATPEQRERMNQANIAWQLMPTKERLQTTKALEAKVGTEVRAPSARAAIEAMNPAKLMDLSTRMQGIGVPLLQANRAWTRLKERSPNIASAVVKMGLGTAFENAVKSQMSKEDFTDFQAIKRQILVSAKATSGAAITASEAPNLASAFGMVMADENQFFNDPATLTSFLNNSVTEYNMLADAVIQYYPHAMDWARSKKGGP
jgi:hypothetical protein